MILLYSIHLGRHIKGFGKPAVKSVRATIAGHLDPETGEIVRPDMDAIRDCLPHYYRKAFDRTGKAMWFPKEPGAAHPSGSAYVALRDSRGRYLNTIYAIPCQFNAGAAA